MFMKDFSHSAAAPVAPLLPASQTPAQSGLLGATLVETATGWRPAETLRIGDALPTWEGGTRRIAALHRQPVAAGTLALILPGGLFDACSDLALLPGQHLLFDTLQDPALPDALPDALAVLVPADALASCPGVRRLCLPRAEAITPVFAEEEVIWANSGVQLHCPGIADGLAQPDSGFFPRLSPVAARAFLARRLRHAA